ERARIHGQMSREWLNDPVNPAMAEWSLQADDLSAGVMLVDLTKPLYRLALSGNFEHYTPVTDQRQLASLRPILGLSGGEGDAVAALAGFDRERDREVRLAGAGRPEEADVGALLDPGELGEMQHERALGGRLGAPVEVLERLQRGEG